MDQTISFRKKPYQTKRNYTRTYKTCQKHTDRPTDQPTDQQTDGPTDLGIKAPSRILKTSSVPEY